MASPAPALALKAAAVAAVLAVLVMPSLGRCPSLGPEQPSPPPAPAPAPAPAIPCSDCDSRCTPICYSYMDKKCGSVCNAPSSDRSAACDACSAQGGLGGDQCNECANKSLQCPNCKKVSFSQCKGECYDQCKATCV